MKGEVMDKRANIAYKYAKEFSTKNKDYASRVKKLPAMIMNNGLGNTLAFSKEKGWNDVIKSIVSWLKEPDCSAHQSDINENNIMERVLSLNSEEYRLLTGEILAYLNWLRRFSSALSKEEGHGDKNAK